MNNTFIQRRNTLLIRLLWILLFVIIFSNSITRTITFYYALTLGIACLVNVVLMILNRSQKTVKAAMYLLICALSAVLFFVIYFKPNTPDYLWIFFALAVSSVYQRIGPVILTTIFLTFITLFYYFTPYKNDIFANASLSDIVYVLFAVYAPAGFMIAQSFISEKIQKEIQESEKKATRHFQQLKTLFAESKHSSEAMDMFMETLQKEIHLNHAFSKESQEKLLDTTNNIHNQNTRIQHIASSVESLKEVLQSLNASSNQMTENVEITQTNSTKGKDLIGNLSLQLTQLSKIIGESVEDMIHLQKDNEEISTILQTIEAISAQTNLLALNASIEASRAGEQGKGFMVIAEEIRRLADHSSLSTKQIHDILHNIYSKTEDTSKKIFLGDEMIRRGGHRMKEVEELFENIAVNASELSTNSSHLENQILHEMKTSIFSISSEINEIYQLAFHNGTNIEQTTEYSQKVSQQMEHIVDHLAILTKQLEGLKALHDTK